MSSKLTCAVHEDPSVVRRGALQPERQVRLHRSRRPRRAVERLRPRHVIHPDGVGIDQRLRGAVAEVVAAGDGCAPLLSALARDRRSLGFHWTPFINVQSWWDERERPNVLLLHYGSDRRPPGPDAQARGLPRHPYRRGGLPEHGRPLRHRLHARAGRDQRADDGRDKLEHGAEIFNKGTNGRWRDVLSGEEAASPTRLPPNASRPTAPAG